MAQLACHRWVASAKNKLWWMTPEWGSTAGELPPETQFLLLEVAPGGPYAVLLPLIDRNTFRCTLRPPAGGDESLVVRAESGDKAVQADRWCGSSRCPVVQFGGVCCVAREGGARHWARGSGPV